MANLLQSSANKTTCAPSYYTNYLTNLANKGQAAQCAAQYVGAQPLQTEAFCQVATNFGASVPTYQAGEQLLGCAANQNIAGAATPYLQAATSASPLCAAKPLICQGASLNIGQLAQCYMSPYISSAAQNLSNIGQRNIQQNLSPQATAATVGSGQFGSQRGAQALGQVEANAEQCLNSQITNLLNTGYGQALSAAGTKEGALGTLAGTTEQAQAAQNQAQLTAAQTAGTTTAEQARALTAAGQGLGTLATQCAAQNLACINALATLGAQCQTIQQNAQCYPFTTLSKLSSLLQGAQIPTSVKSTMCMSPLSGVAGVGSIAAGLFTPGKCGVPSLFCSIKSAFGGTKNNNNSNSNSNNTSNSNSNNTSSNSLSCCRCECLGGLPLGCASGGLVKAARGGSIGCRSLSHLGGLPSRRK